jgi:PAS domain S-box-containing protein
MILLIDGEGKILEVNNRLQDWTGYKTKDFIGKIIFEMPFISKNSVDIIKQNFTRRLKGEDMQPYEIELLKKNGDIGIGLVRGALITGQNNEIIGDLVLVSDMTVLKEKEEQVTRKIAELEKLNKLMIGREIKMVELKKSIESLQKNKNE